MRKIFFKNGLSFRFIVVLSVFVAMGVLVLVAVLSGKVGNATTYSTEIPPDSKDVQVIAKANIRETYTDKSTSTPDSATENDLIAKNSTSNNSSTLIEIIKNISRTDPKLTLPTGELMDAPKVLPLQREESESGEEKKGPGDALARNVEMMKDPALGYVPTDRLLAAKRYKDELMRDNIAPISGVNWKEQGPNNLGGRIRALTVDTNEGTRSRELGGGL